MSDALTGALKAFAKSFLETGILTAAAATVYAYQADPRIGAVALGLTAIYGFINGAVDFSIVYLKATGKMAPTAPPPTAQP